MATGLALTGSRNGEPSTPATWLTEAPAQMPRDLREIGTSGGPQRPAADEVIPAERSSLGAWHILFGHTN